MAHGAGHAQCEAPNVSLRRYGASEAFDVHDFHQIVLGLDGAMAMAVDGTAREIDARSAWLIPAGARHDYAGIGVNRQLVLDLPAASLAVPQRLFERARATRLAPASVHLVRALAGEAQEVPPRGGLPAGSGFARASQRFHWAAAARLCGALLADTGVTACAAHDAAGLDFVRIDRWLRAHLTEPLRIADLAAHCGFGMRRFHELFVEAFGETPHRYLQRLRLDAALLLMADAHRTLSDVALDVGFADQSTFTHAFTRRFGLAPGQWRALRH